jgi:Mrp family chromosome partitioning ATPase
MRTLDDAFSSLSLSLFSYMRERREKRAAQEAGFATVVVTSARAGDGKSFVARGLATMAALLSDYRVLLVDANFEAPAAARLYQVPIEAPGFSDLLAGGHAVPLASISMPPKLRLLPAGNTAMPELLYREAAYERFLEKIAEDFDVIIFDAGAVPPAGANALMRMGQRILFVVNSSKTRREVAYHALSKLGGAEDERLWGVVLNKRLWYIPRRLYRDN